MPLPKKLLEIGDHSSWIYQHVTQVQAPIFPRQVHSQSNDEPEVAQS